HTRIYSECVFSIQSYSISQVDLLHHGLLILFPIYQLVLYMDALKLQNIIQLFTFILFGLLTVIFSIIQSMQHRLIEEIGCNAQFSDEVITPDFNSTLLRDAMDTQLSNMRPFEYSIMVIVPVCFIIICACSFKLYSFFRWKYYVSHHFINVALRNAVIVWVMLTSFLKLVFFFLFIYGVQLIPNYLLNPTQVYPLEGCIVMIVGFSIFMLATYAIGKENIRILSFFAMTSLGMTGYFIYRIFTFGLSQVSSTDMYMLTKHELIFTTLILILLLLVILVLSVLSI
ncbi:hypothetical protein BDB01DRAFT_704214, partial [Pilobolus umbonatus]